MNEETRQPVAKTEARSHAQSPRSVMASAFMIRDRRECDTVDAQQSGLIQDCRRKRASLVKISSRELWGSRNGRARIKLQKLTAQAASRECSCQTSGMTRAKHQPRWRNTEKEPGALQINVRWSFVISDGAADARKQSVTECTVACLTCSFRS